jgi:quercetin dioxygenase-like cupin family protein
MWRKYLIVPVAFAFIGAASAQQVPSPVQPAPVKRTIIAKNEVPGSNYEVTSAIVEIQPGFKAGRHLHPGEVQVQVTDGEFWLAIDGQPEKTYTAGQTFVLPARAIHNEGSTGTVPAKLFVVYILEKGQPLANPVK